MDSYLKHYINGQWVDSIGGKRHEVISPSTEEACTEITLGTQADVDAAVAAAKAAFVTFSQTSREERLALMGRILEEYKKRIPDLATSMANEMGAPVSFASTAQVGAGMGGGTGRQRAAITAVALGFRAAAEVDQVVATAQQEDAPDGNKEDWCALATRNLTDQIP